VPLVADSGERVPLTTSSGAPVVVKRSARRRRTVSAAWRDGAAVISIPGHFSQAQEQEWVPRRGSATPARGSIRISDKIKEMPAWVVDYVILHELAHLLESGHGPRFWRLLQPYPQLERAKAFLSGAAFAMGRGLQDDDDVVDGAAESDG